MKDSKPKYAFVAKQDKLVSNSAPLDAKDFLCFSCGESYAS